MKAWVPFAGVGFLAALAGTSLWLAGSPTPDPTPKPGPVEASSAAIMSAKFVDLDGKSSVLGQLRGNVIVVNFWATWCTPCLDEMPGFARLQAKWEARGVRFVGLAQDDPLKVRAFGERLAINYPLWTGEAAVMDLSRRLGNRIGVLPHTVLLDADGIVLESRIGIYAEDKLDARLGEILAKGAPP
jgi:thiol-disulfide isomerase/thioredoxin